MRETSGNTATKTNFSRSSFSLNSYRVKPLSRINKFKIWQQAEADAVATFNQANEKINHSISTSRTAVDRDQAIGQLQQIIFQLEAIDNGTTVYSEVRQLLISAKQKQQEWQH